MSAESNGNGHPDPTGPDEPDEPAAARDGVPAGGGRNLHDAITGEGSDVEPPEPPPLPGDKQLSLGGLARRGQPIEAMASLMSAATRVGGQFEPDKERVLVVTVLPHGYTQRPVREAGVTKRWKYVQQLRPLSVQTVADMRGVILTELAEHYAGDSDVATAIDNLRDAIAMAEEREGELAAA
jgi:hypothetical protein